MPTTTPVSGVGATTTVSVTATSTVGDPESSAPAPTSRATSTQASAVQLYSASPTTGAVGAVITLTGSGFTADNTVLFDGKLAAANVHLSSFTNGRQSLTFVMPNSLTANCKKGMACPMYVQLLNPGIHQISMENQNGISNSIDFVVTDATSLLDVH